MIACCPQARARLETERSLPQTSLNLRTCFIVLPPAFSVSPSCSSPARQGPQQVKSRHLFLLQRKAGTGKARRDMFQMSLGVTRDWYDWLYQSASRSPPFAGRRHSRFLEPSGNRAPDRTHPTLSEAFQVGSCTGFGNSFEPYPARCSALYSLSLLPLPSPCEILPIHAHLWYRCAPLLPLPPITPIAPGPFPPSIIPRDTPPHRLFRCGVSKHRVERRPTERRSSPSQARGMSGSIRVTKCMLMRR